MKPIFFVNTVVRHNTLWIGHILRGNSWDRDNRNAGGWGRATSSKPPGRRSTTNL